MYNPLKKLFSKTVVVEKQAGNDNPFSAILQTKFAEFFGASAKEEQLKAYRGWVFAAVQAISQEVSDIELHLMKRNADGEAEEVLTHPVLELLKKVNPRMTKHELFEITQSHQELEGNAFWFLARDNNGKGKIREIWPLRPDRVTFIIDEDNPLMISKYIYRQRGGAKIMFEPTDILHFAQFNNEAEYPFPSRGLGTVQAAAKAIDTNFFAGEWNRNFFLNSARPDILLKTSASLAPDQYEQLKRKWASAFQGLDKTHKMIILQGGLELEKLSENQKDMDFINQLTASRDEILAVFRVPKSVLGISDGTVNRATAEASNFIFARGTIKPKMQRIADTLTEFLLPLFGEEGLWFDFESPVPEDRDAKVKEWAAGINEWLTINDIRNAEGLPPTQQGDSIFKPFSIQPVDTVIPEEKAQATPKEKTKKPKKPRKAPKNVKEVIEHDTQDHINELFAKKATTTKKKVKKLPPKEKTMRGLTFDQVEKLRPIWIKNIKDNEKVFGKKIQEFFDAQEKRVIASLTEGLKGLKKKEFKLKQVNDLLPDIGIEIDLLDESTRASFEEFLRQGGQLAFDTLALDQTFDPAETLRSQEFIDDRIKLLTEKINDTTFEELRPLIEDGLEQNQSVAEISQRIADDVFEKTRDFRTDRIARTEVAEAQNFGNIEAFKQAGVTHKQWVNFDPIDDTVDSCSPVPDTVPIDDEFSNGLQHPPKHPNCVCTTIAIFEE